MSIKRKLATIQMISEINTIPNADLIECAKVLGWNVVIKKSENYKVGDKIIYCEIDSLFPKEERYKFLENHNYRIRTQNFRGQISQGLILPLSILPKNNYEIGDDVTDILHITKYEEPIPTELFGKVKKGYSAYLPKSDETRVQLLQEILTQYKGLFCFGTEKVDGTSSSFTLEINENSENEFNVYGHNYCFFEDSKNVFWIIAKKYKIKNILEDYFIKTGLHIAIQGEIIGYNIQKNKYNLKTNEFDLYVFNVWDIDNQRYFDFNEFVNFCNLYQLKTVPIIYAKFQLIDDIDKLVELSKGFSVINPKTKREGIVWRPLIEIPNIYNLGRLSFKVINPEFLLKYKE